MTLHGLDITNLGLLKLELDGKNAKFFNVFTEPALFVLLIVSV